MAKIHYPRRLVGRNIETACGIIGVVDDRSEFTRTDNGRENRCDYTLDRDRATCKKCASGSKVWATQ